MHGSNSQSGLKSRVSDPHWFNADPDTDPDPAFFLIADPDSGSGSRLLWPNIDKKLLLKKTLNLFVSKTTIYLFLGIHKGRPSYRRSLQPSKENIQYLKTWKFWTFFYFCGSFLPSWIRVRIQQLKLMRIRIRIRIRIRNPAKKYCPRYINRQSARLFLQSSELGPPTTLPTDQCVPSPFFLGRDTLACDRGGGGSNLDEGTNTVVL